MWTRYIVFSGLIFIKEKSLRDLLSLSISYQEGGGGSIKILSYAAKKFEINMALHPSIKLKV